MTTTPTPDPLDGLLHEYTVTHMGNSHNAQCRCNSGAKSYLKNEINALMIPRKAVEDALPQKVNADPKSVKGLMTLGIAIGYNQAISDIRAALGMDK